MLSHQESYNSHKVKLITFISFLYGFELAMEAYILAFYYQSAIHSEKVTIFFFGSYVVFLFALLSLHKLVKKIGKSFSLTFFATMKIVILVCLSALWSTPSVPGAIALALFVVFSNLSWVMLDVMLESFSADSLSGRIRGLFLTIANTGFILGPFLSFKVLENNGYGGIFLILLAIEFIIFVFIVASLQNINHAHSRKGSIMELMKLVWSRRDVLKVYYIAFILDFFYSTMIIYSPMYLTNLGLTLNEISVIFTIMLVPFIVLQYPAGRLADKKYGEKKMLIFSFLIMTISVGAIYFISSKSVLIWSIVLFATRIGAALVEVLRDSYFYKRIDGQDVEIIDFFRTSKPIAYIVFSLFSFFLLSLKLGIGIVFLLLAAISATGIWISFKLEENSVSKK